MNFNLNSMIGKKSGLRGSLDASGADFSANVSTIDVVNRIKQVLARTPGIEKANGKIDVHVKGKGKKTLTFNYK